MSRTSSTDKEVLAHNPVLLIYLASCFDGAKWGERVDPVLSNALIVNFFIFKGNDWCGCCSCAGTQVHHWMWGWKRNGPLIVASELIHYR